MPDERHQHQSPDHEPDSETPDEMPPANITPHDEPPVDASDTRPRPAAASPETALAAEEPPIDPRADTAPKPAAAPPRAGTRPLLLLAVMAGTLCICATLVGLAGFAGYRDGLATNDARVTETMATGIYEQYATGVADLEAGNAELAALRFEWIVETIQPAAPYMHDSAMLLETARAVAAFTATPTPSATPTASLTPLPATDTPTATIMPTSGAVPDGDASYDPEDMFQQAEMALRVGDYEDAIEWLDALRAIAPDYRVSEVRPRLMEALTRQGLIYIRGANTDGEDKLQRGVNLIYRAQELGSVEPGSALYEAQVAERYINARSALAGNNYAVALPILEQLCAESEATCNWSYRGVSVRDLLEQARAGQDGS